MGALSRRIMLVGSAAVAAASLLPFSSLAARNVWPHANLPDLWDVVREIVGKPADLRNEPNAFEINRARQNRPELIPQIERAIVERFGPFPVIFEIRTTMTPRFEVVIHGVTKDMGYYLSAIDYEYPDLSGRTFRPARNRMA